MCKDDRPEVQCWTSYWDLPYGPVSLPVKGSAGRTGDWRTFRPVVDNEKCIKCYFCYMYCPEGTISVDDETGFVKIDYDYCKGCGVCANNCPKECIAMEKENK
ncbi:MAG: 4Fe-4S binding protein [Promethearchaeota archaeon]